MIRFNVVATLQFKKELDQIFSPFFNSSNILHEKQKIYDILSNLSFFPERYCRISNFYSHEKLNIRKIPIGKFIIIYEVDKENQQVHLLHIFYGNQDYFNLL